MKDSIFPAVCTRKPSQPFETRYGQRIKAEFQLESGSVVAVFTDATDAQFQRIRQGQHVDLVHGSKGYSVGRVGEVSALPPQARQATGGAPFLPQPSEAEMVAAKVQKDLKILSYCYKLVTKDESFKHLSEDGQRQMAVTLFIQSHR